MVIRRFDRSSNDGITTDRNIGALPEHRITPEKHRRVRHKALLIAEGRAPFRRQRSRRSYCFATLKKFLMRIPLS